MGTEVNDSYADTLRKQLPELNPVIDDLFLLEAHQIVNLPERAPREELAIVLHANPGLVRFLVKRQPAIEQFVAALLKSQPDGAQDVPGATDRLLWEIADLIVYQRAPALYDEKFKRLWDRTAIVEAEPLENKTVIDGGAGTGHVTFVVAKAADVVYAVEPVATLRDFVRRKARHMGLSNVIVLDGLLDRIPLPADSADVLLTHRAIGWHLISELREIERVLRPGGTALHLTGLPYPAADAAPLHIDLLGGGYEERSYADGKSLNRKYFKRT